MSYIIKSVQPFASTKLTETGREKLSKGQLTFTSWSIGDSEVNYNREILTQSGVLTGDTSVVLRPKDRQPDLKYFINTGSGSNAFAFGSGDVRCVKLTVNNEADERGPFVGDLFSGFKTIVENDYVISKGTQLTETISGTTIGIDDGTTNVNVGDIILLKLYYDDFNNEIPQPHLFYKIQEVSPTILTLDRELPTIIGEEFTYIIYKGGNIYDNEPDAIAYWDTGTLSFDSSCDITVLDVPLWNMNIPFSEDILGTTDVSNNERLMNYGSYNYIGEKDNYLYGDVMDYIKSSAIIHYSNKTISNLYGEFLYIDNDTKTVRLHLPDLMYHRRVFSGSTTGDKMGMTFVASGVTVSTGENGLTYVPLIEDPTLVNGEPKQVGRVFPNLKIITIDDPEIIASMSYKANRNWTLPKFNLTLRNPSGGVNTGLLGNNMTIFVTYAINNVSGVGITRTLPCQDYTILTNTTSTSLDVQFNIEDIGLLPFMRNNDVEGGFYGNEFKVIYQITDGTRPVTDAWREIDFTSSVENNNFIDVDKLETQNPLAVNPVFQLTQINDGDSKQFSIIDDLSMAPVTSPEILQFGDERFFYGNVETYIGATIFKTIFKVAINASDFNTTTNITRSLDITSNPPNIKVSEVGIYDSDGDLVIISKLSVPIELTAGKTVILELSMDF